MPGWIPFDVGFSDLSRMNANRCKIRRVLVKRTRSRRARRIRKKPKCVWHVNHDNVAMVALASARQQMTDIRWKHRFPRFARNDEAPLRVGDAATCLRRFRTKSICVPIGHWPLLSARTLPSFVCFGFCWLCCRVFNGIANARTSEKKRTRNETQWKKERVVFITLQIAAKWMKTVCDLMWCWITLGTLHAEKMCSQARNEPCRALCVWNYYLKCISMRLLFSSFCFHSWPPLPIVHCPRIDSSGTYCVCHRRQ